MKSQRLLHFTVVFVVFFSYKSCRSKIYSFAWDETSKGKAASPGHFFLSCSGWACSRRRTWPCLLSAALECVWKKTWGKITFGIRAPCSSFSLIPKHWTSQTIMLLWIYHLKLQSRKSTVASAFLLPVMTATLFSNKGNHYGKTTSLWSKESDFHLWSLVETDSLISSEV